MSTCQHASDTQAVRDVRARTPHACEACLREGTRWVHLRLCLACGHVGCCDDSPRRHATAHFRATAHPVMQSHEPREDWGWCYVDELFLEPAPRPRLATAERGGRAD
jgi:hypothetical protein